MSLLDRYLWRHFLTAFLICLVSLLCLYITIDAFTRMDDFLESAAEGGVLRLIVAYYAVRLPLLFQRLHAVLLMLASLFTLAWLDGGNELLAVRAAGVSTYRLIRPLVLANVAFLFVGLVNREVVQPPLGPYLQIPASEWNRHRGQRVQGCYDDSGVHIEARVGYPERQMIQFANVTLPSPVTGRLVHIESKEMFYHPHSDPEQHGWVLKGVTSPPLADDLPNLRRLDAETYFLRTNVTYQRLTRSPDWYRYLSTPELASVLLSEGRFPHRNEALALFHRRFTQPCIDLLLVLVCLWTVASSVQRNAYLNFACCMGLYLLLQVTDFLVDHMTRKEALDPFLAAWLPLFLLGPVAFALLVPDREPTPASFDCGTSSIGQRPLASDSSAGDGRLVAEDMQTPTRSIRWSDRDPTAEVRWAAPSASTSKIAA
jgi:lipopolysaccharide export system permease protein